ncbi:MAG: tRNA uridine-5-carboxymethylaminomethyl(34) synthesis enzyme MnmG [Paludibacteraceae bacterium]|nr:tRNA uridine-5-carboxymethylaminomethyl(34) synthesis enzyme MnmG [Paludibacteraceae bacterium]MBN2787040.1 tRNA uridine-5-carboxymethylaminomethyl(34) synthesis enzyme MnmG [Paludibacteraceae bacterium]
MKFKYDVIVIGAGHAGNEAACTAANLGSKTLLITMDMNKIGQMSCNPAIGGIAKGQIVREIDAMGGQMGIVTDKTAIQFRLLNQSKGPAMWSPRAQSDREEFIREWKRTLENTPNLDLWQDTVTQILVKNGVVIGVKTLMNVEFDAKCVILTAGTFLNGLMHIGKVQIEGGRVSEPASYGLTEQLKSLGFVADRMKTGTPVRIDGRSIDFSELTEQKGEDDFHKFSYLDYTPRPLQQLSCWITYTSLKTHQLLEKGLEVSPMYNGQIKSIGPRYCPSIETKIVTFAEKERHQLFVEPEGVNSQEFYLNGFSSSLPLDIQYDALRTIKGFENARIYRPGYAIEYDFFDPTQLTHTLETKLVKNLFFAGQVNGTTGYEEAAGQGMIAAINAHLNCHGGKAFTLNRDEAYIGVLIDDLVTKGVDEPYRMFTSRAEYRILLRQDNADMRLTEKAFELGLATKERQDLLQEKKAHCERITTFIRNKSVKISEANSMLEPIGSSTLKHGGKMIDLLLRPEITIQLLAENFTSLKEEIAKITNRKEEILEACEILIKYEGYIDREKGIADKLKRLENIKLKGRINYETVNSISTEAKQKLKRIDPETIGQASRISGISPSDINILLILLGR